MRNFVPTTVLGGVIFLVPVVCFVVLVLKALSWMHKLATPLVNQLTPDHFAGAVVVHLVSLLLLVAVCYLTGLFAKTQAASRLVEGLESGILMKFPPYALIKNKSGSILNPEDRENLTPVLLRLDDTWQVAFEIEKIEQDKHMVFLPGAPDPWSGSVTIVDSERLSVIDTSVKTVNNIMQRLGKGAGQVIQI